MAKLKASVRFGKQKFWVWFGSARISGSVVSKNISLLNSHMNVATGHCFMWILCYTRRVSTTFQETFYSDDKKTKNENFYSSNLQGVIVGLHPNMASNWFNGYSNKTIWYLSINEALSLLLCKTARLYVKMRRKKNFSRLSSSLISRDHNLPKCITT